MGRYTLTMETYDNQTVNVRFNEAGKMTSKVSLKTIDKFTTETTDENDLLKKLKVNLKIKNIDITYIFNKEIRTTPIAYNDKKDLAKIKMISNSAIDTNNSVFNKVIYEFLELLEEKSFFLYAMGSDLLTIKQKEYIEMRIYYGVYTKFYEDKLKLHSSSYHQFRNILFLIEKYTLIKQNKNVPEPVTDMEEFDDHDPDEENLYSEEEKRKFQEYMDSLPDGVPDYLEEEDEMQKVKRV